MAARSATSWVAKVKPRHLPHFDGKTLDSVKIVTSQSNSAMSISRSSRACMVCSIVQSNKQFLQNGCPNCEEILQLRNSPDAIAECTSPLFEGIVTMGDPKGSWVAKWLRLTEYVPAMYAVKVKGTLPKEVVETLEDNGIVYVPRDGGEGEGARE